MMKLGIMQPYLLPYIGYFQLINIVDKFVVFDDVNYIKKGWINRNNILINNRKTLFTLPVEKASQNQMIKNIRIFEPIINKEKLLDKIVHSYRRAPQFESTYLLIKNILLNTEKNISDYNINSIKEICRYLDIKTDITKASCLKNNKDLKAEDKIIDICKLVNYETYINPIGGFELYSKEKFSKNNIELYFIKTKNIKYEQFNSNYVEDLSIIDVLMFNKKEKIKKMLDECILL